MVFDTSALMTPSRDGIDVFDEAERLLGGCEALVPDAVFRELENLTEEGNDNASVALELVENEGCAIVETDESHGDNAVVEVATDDEGRSAVATNDAKLKERLLKLNVPVLYPRQRNRLEVAYP